MNLSKKLETEVEIEGTIYPVNTAFDNIINILDLLKNRRLNDVQKVHIGLQLFLGETLTMETEKMMKLFEVLIQTFIYEEEHKRLPEDLEGNLMPVIEKAPTYDLKHDGGYIYTSFRQAYQLNLFELQGKLDWREFKQLLQDLPEDTKFKQVIDIRTRPYPKGKHASEERKQLKDLKRQFALPSP